MSDKPAQSAARPLLLLVDDDPLIVDSLQYFLGREFDILAAATRLEARERLDAATTLPALALVDLGLPPLPHRPDEGYALISELLARAPDIRIVVLSGQNDDANARHARVLGAADFVAKPADPQHLLQLLRQLLSVKVGVAAAGGGAQPADALLIGDSAPMQALRLQLRQFANAPFPVLIEGESGSGKELVANALQGLSERADRPFFVLNCAAIAPTLVEPTLFGHAKGAFTGASGARAGYFEDAADGTLFLDEIGELPLDLQPKLLRVLENGEYQRVGETQSRVSRARIIAATNRDLKHEVREGRFRADLYHRLSVFTLAVPPVRTLGDDRQRLLDHFRTTFSRQFGNPPFTLSAAARDLWLGYPFPGNVRELRNIVVRLSVKHAGAEIDSAALQEELDEGGVAPGQAAALPATQVDFEAAAIAQLRDLPAGEEFSLDRLLQRWELAYINAAQQLTHGNLSQAAKLLGVNRTTLYNRIETLTRGRGS